MSSETLLCRLPSEAALLTADVELFHEFWPIDGYDREFGKALSMILAQCRADAVLAHISGRGTKMHFVRPSARSSWSADEIDELFSSIGERIGTDPKPQPGELHEISFKSLKVFLVVVPERTSDRLSTGTRPLGSNYCCAVYSGLTQVEGDEDSSDSSDSSASSDSID